VTTDSHAVKCKRLRWSGNRKKRDWNGFISEGHSHAMLAEVVNINNLRTKYDMISSKRL